MPKFWFCVLCEKGSFRDNAWRMEWLYQRTKPLFLIVLFPPILHEIFSRYVLSIFMRKIWRSWHQNFLAKLLSVTFQKIDHKKNDIQYNTRHTPAVRTAMSRRLDNEGQQKCSVAFSGHSQQQTVCSTTPLTPHSPPTLHFSTFSLIIRTESPLSIMLSTLLGTLPRGALYYAPYRYFLPILRHSVECIHLFKISL